jgi:glycerol transport system ATP-binding protein
MSLELQSVTKRVGAEIHVAEVSLSLERGSLNVLLGPTLAGKTTLMRLMAGLEVPSAGRVLVDGRDVTGLPVQRRSVAMVYQQFINYPNLTVYENIASPLRVARRPRAEIDREVQRAAELVRLTPLLQRRPLELSGGQQQRTALARAIVKGADLLLLDEPLANLDYKLREELREELPPLFAESGAVLVYATTEPLEALFLGGNTATLHEGRLVQFGRTADVYHRPSSIVSAQIFSDPPMNTVAVTKRGAVFHLGDQLALPVAAVMTGLADGDYVLGFRAHHLYLRRPGPGSVPLSARVSVAEISGSETFVHVTFAGCSWVALAHGVHELAMGQVVELHLDPGRFFVFGRDGRLAAAPAVRAAA